jgi:putative copper export protein/mono/diheme cytochrome c family protein
MASIVLTLVRALHYSAMVSLAGTLLIEAWVAGPALRRLGDDGTPGFWRWCSRLTWASVVLGILSGLLWLFFEAGAMSGKPVALVFSEGIISVVLERTRFGHDWLLRGMLALPLIACLLARQRSGAPSSRVLAGTSLALAAAELVTIAGAGHAAAGTGWAGTLQLLADAAHLIAAGAWIGGLLPFAWLFATVRRAGGPLAADAASEGAARFSRIGLLAVATLVVTGSANSIFLVGSVPALLGTDYGHLLLVKLALFLTMVTFAAINRQWLVPQLARGGVSSPGAGRALVAQIERNARIEAALGLLVLVLVGALGTKPPALHLQPQWPLPFRLSLATLVADPAARAEALGTGVLALAGIGLFLYGLKRAHQRTLHLLLGLFLALAVGWWPLRFMIIPAYPTTFFRSGVAFAASSIAHGGAVYAEHCAACHGVSGAGDGPLAAGTPVRPADLTAAHIFEHSDGDLFWWISNGIPAGGMPGFAAQLDERQRWDVINFIHARASAREAALGPAVTSAPAPLAPEFSFARNGTEETLRQAREQGAVLLIFYRLPGSRARLGELAGGEDALAASGLRLIAVADDRATTDTRKSDNQPDFAVDADEGVTAAYTFFAGSSRFDHCEFLVDRAGFQRARWCADFPGGLADARSLAAAAQEVAALPLEAPAHTHVHDGMNSPTPK